MDVQKIIEFYNDYIEYKNNPEKFNILKERINKNKKKKDEIFIPSEPPKLPTFAFSDDTN